MLTELSIRNFAIIDQIAITFHEGLTVLSGETGAGKSIIIDAIQLLAGGRASVEFVRHGEEKAEIEGLFLIDSKSHPIHKVGEQYGVEIQDDEVVLHRVITISGKSICRVNGKLVTLAILREFGKTLIDIHSQHETQSLMVPENHIELLDLYNRAEIDQVKEEYSDLFNKLQALKQRYKALNENEQEMAQRLDLLEFQLQELEKANLQPDEDIELEKERNQLVNYEKIYTSIHSAYNALYGEQRGLEWLNQAVKALEENSSFDEFVAKKSEELSNHYYLLEDLSFELSHYLESLEYDPNRLNEIEGRLSEIGRLKKKYGTSVSEILEYMATLEEEIEQIKNKDSHLKKLADEIEEVKQDAYLEAKQLHDLRKKAADALTLEVHEELKDLYLEKASFSIHFKLDSTASETLLHKNGYDQIRFLISTNKGEPLKEISKVASGGELSRIMLVLKKIFAKHQGVTSVIFDEVDTGVSGRVAQAIAEKIFQISNDSQVLCITHLPQVAAMADTHMLIEKIEVENRTATQVLELTEQEQINELSRMITGTKLTETAKEHAKELLELATSFKKITIPNG
ncbi:DNA repair protein RecN [Ornithinibacillus contaminans]|uniref:DNA repair protein RecN n=1 Tax=Ornithinibacillus contaminans TaxID=694055 RepID=UPI00064E022A|nr:DNA repair protein RecN [Ornithinibacillus contaminans]